MKKSNKLYIAAGIVAIILAIVWLHFKPSNPWACVYAGYVLALLIQAVNRVVTRKVFHKPTLTKADVKDCVISYDGGATWHLKTQETGQYIKLNGDAVKQIIDSHAASR